MATESTIWAHRLRDNRLSLVAVAAVILVIGPLLAFTAIMMGRGRSHAIEMARADVAELARAASFITTQSLHAVDEAMLSLMFNPPVTDPAKLALPEVRGILTAALSNAKGVSDLYIADGAGVRINGADPVGAEPPGRAEKPRPFVPSLDGLTAGFSVSHVFMSGNGRHWSVYVSRPLRMDDGTLNWLVSELPVDALIRGYEAIIDRPGLSILLSRDDDRIIASAPLDEELMDQIDPGGAVAMMARGPGAGEEVISVRRQIAAYPVTVSARVTSDLALDPFRRQTLRDIAIVTAVLVVVGGLGFGLYRAQAKWRGADALLRHAIDSMSEGFVVFDANERLLLCNDKFRALYPGLDPVLRPGTPYRVIARAAAEAGVYHDVGDIDAFVAAELESFRGGGPPRERALPGGRWLQISERKMADGGSVGVHTDVTKLREQQEALINASAELARAKTAAEAANLSKSRFLTTMSHELRTPLNAIIGFAEIIRGQIFGRDAIDQYAEYAADIASSGELLLSLINDVLDMSKIEANRFVVTPQKIDLAAALSAATNMVRARAAERHVTLTPAPKTAVTAFADPRSVKQIALNLLSNAIKFTRSGGSVTVEIDPPADGMVEFRVIDTGIGMTERELQVCMQPFGQAHNALTREQSGTGLGLPISANLAELNGGRFIVTSARGEGTTVRVILPVVAPAEPSPEGSTAKDAAETASA